MIHPGLKQVAIRTMSDVKKTKAETQRAVIQQDTVGAYAVNSLSLTAFHDHRLDVLIAQTQVDEGLYHQLKNQSQWTVADQTINLQGKLFNGIADAFYRGHLPELLIITCEITHIPEFLEEFLDFLDKLCSLGFIQGHHSQENSQIDRYIPQLVIATYGIVFETIQNKLSRSIENMGHFSAWERDRILQKLCRMTLSNGYNLLDINKQPFQIFPTPLSVQCAGSKSFYTLRSTQLLESRKFDIQFNPNGDLGILELELHQAYEHLTTYLIPFCQAQFQLETASLNLDINDWFSQLEVALGCIPGLLTQHAPSAVPAASHTKRSDLPTESNGIGFTDVALLHQLKVIFDEYQIEQPAQSLEVLLKLAKPSLKQTLPSHSS